MTAESPSSDEFRHLRVLEKKYQLRLPNINAAIDRSRRIRELLEKRFKLAAPENCSLVLCGSLGRFEVTSGSDIDWTLLVDGPVDAAHREVVNDVGREIEAVRKAEGLEEPSQVGPFARMMFSHELVHQIGGDEDMNSNITRRMLLLLEAHPISEPHILNRVVAAILDRYLDQSVHAYRKETERDFFPRFLMNDVVRFWRTMAVDCGAKIGTRDAKKWALRNAKLRFSRKLLFVAGLLLAYESILAPRKASRSGSGAVQSVGLDLIARTQEMTKLPPLDTLARGLLFDPAWPGLPDAAKAIFDSYDAFLGIVADDNKRKELTSLRLDQAANSATFQEIRNLGRNFQKGLDDFFYRGPEDVSKLTYSYSLF